MEELNIYKVKAHLKVNFNSQNHTDSAFTEIAQLKLKELPLLNPK